MTDLTLKPHETRAINLRKLRDAQKPDFWSKKIPANAENGSVYWVALGSGPTLAGRMLVLRAREGLASNFDCGDTCPASLLALTICPMQNDNMPQGECQWQAMAEYQDSNGTYVYSDRTSETTWSTDNSAVATFDATTPGLMYVGGGGSANASGSYQGFDHFWNGVRCVAGQITVNGILGFAIHDLAYKYVGLGYPCAPYRRCNSGPDCPSPILCASYFGGILPTFGTVMWLSYTSSTLKVQICIFVSGQTQAECVKDPIL
ncbi:MAG: hypothetical protein ACRD18_08245 [Terriglobia bacterium]